MKSLSPYLKLLTLLFTIFPMLLMGQWQYIDSIVGGDAIRFHETSDQIFAGRHYGLKKTDRNTINWISEDWFGFTRIEDVTSQGDSVFVVFRDYDWKIRITNSYDGGNTWTESFLVSELPLEDLTIANCGGNLVVTGRMAQAEFKIYTSYDWGQSWIDAATLQLGANNNILYHDESNYGILFNSDYYLQNGLYFYNPTQDSLYYYDDIQQVQSAVFSGEKIIASGSVSNLMFGSNATISFNGELIDHPFSNDTFAYSGILHKNGNAIYLIAEKNNYINIPKRILKSLDEGETWVDLGAYDLPFSETSLEPLANGKFIGANHFSFIIYDLTENSYQFASFGNDYGVSNVTFINNNLHCWSQLGNSYKSEDFGETINNQGYFHDPLLSGMKHNGDTIVFVTQLYNRFRFYRSFDNGNSYNFIPFDQNDINSLEANRYSPGNLLEYYNGRVYLTGSRYETENSIYYSDNLGESWTLLPGSEEIGGELAIFNGKLYSFTKEGSTTAILYQYDLEDESWNFIDLGYGQSSYDQFNTLKVADSVLFVNGRDNDDRIILSDGISYINPNESISDICRAGNNFYVINSNSLYISSGNLNNLQNIELNFPGDYYSKVSSHDDYLYFYGGTTGIWKTKVPLTMQVRVFMDINNNGIQDPGENGVANQILQSTISGYTASTNNEGECIVIFTELNEPITLLLNESYLVANPNSFNAVSNGEISIPLQFNSEILNMTIDMTALNVFRPGFETNISINVADHGNINENSIVRLLLPQGIDFQSASINPNSINGNEVIWNIPALNAYQNIAIDAILISDSTNQMGDSLLIYASVNTVGSDFDTTNNHAVIEDVFVSSYDPNDKTCSLGNVITPVQLALDETFVYTIRFQNTGNYLAEDVVIRDTLSEHFRLNTLQILATSHPNSFSLSGNARAIAFHFNGIELPDSASNEPESHGFIKYAIKCNQQITLGTQLRNTAHIYFDFNSPIVTNTTVTTYQIPKIDEDNSISTNVLITYPNPANDYFNLNLIPSTDQQIQLIDICGRLVYNEVFQDSRINVSNLSSGIYFGAIVSSGGNLIQNFKVSVNR
jgi:uncharacterized repeat protein (TIGR01451 family)